MDRDARYVAGVGEPSVNRNGLNGNYVEYAYTVGSDQPRTVCAIWWDSTAEPVAAYMLGYWTEGVGQKWEPLRDLWARGNR